MPVPADLFALSQTAGSNFPAGSEAPTTADDYLRFQAACVAVLRDGKGFADPVQLASGATTDIGGQNSMFVEITGTTTITSLGSNYNGPRFLRFTGALTLTHNSTTVNLPGAANITTAAGDTAIAVPNLAGTGWNVVNYQLATPILAVPAGTVVHVAMSSAPTGYLKCNGAAVSRTTYAALFAAIGTTFGTGDGSTTFNLPELRGEFIRGLDDSRGVDAARALGSAQSSANLSHSHTLTDPGHDHDETINNGGSAGMGNLGAKAITNSGSNQTIDGYIGTATTGITMATSGGTEARPRNVALLAVIKF